MKIGLVRHYKVNQNSKNFINSNEFTKSIINYDKSNLIYSNYNLLNINWDICYCSKLSRAIKTAKNLSECTIKYTQLLNEVPINPVFNTNLKLHKSFWFLVGRLAWKLNHKSQPESYLETKKRCKLFIKKLMANKLNNNLIVTHGFYMNMLKKELHKIGFKGSKFIRAKNGYIYLLEL